MAGQYGVKETKEAILGLVVIGKIVKDVIKLNGGIVGDVTAVVAALMDPANRAAIEAAVQDADKVPAEVKELDFADILELAKVIPEILGKLA